MIDTPANINQLWADLVVEELVRCGVTIFALSPGSRSTPLTIAVAQHPKAQAVMHYDERGAAFWALGHAKYNEKPVALVCTSGTATANYMPAVVEAAQSFVPLILLTADRPPELLDTGANQAIIQPGLYDPYLRWFFNLPCPDPRIDAEVALTAVDQAVFRSRTSPDGPVQLNCMFREPLAPTRAKEDLESCQKHLTRWKENGKPYTAWQPPIRTLPGEQQRILLNHLNKVKKGLLVVGQLRNRREAEAVDTLAHDLHWPVFADITSGLRLGKSKPPYVPYYDQLLLSPEFKEKFRPEFVLHLGGPFVSKRLLQFLDEVRPEYLHVAQHPYRQDPNHQVTERFFVDIEEFSIWLGPSVRDRGVPRWGLESMELSRMVDTAVDQWQEEMATLSEVNVARLISRLSHGDGVLFLGNSMPVRDMDMYGAADSATGWVLANRGASGIDGQIATAVGAAHGFHAPVTAIIGDLTALHDLNSLALLRNSATPVILILVNNDGGGIFHFLPVAEQAEVFEPYFGTPHGLNFEHAAALFELEYHQALTTGEIASAYKKLLNKQTSGIIEVRTGRTINHRLHLQLQATIQEAVAQALVE